MPFSRAFLMVAVLGSIFAGIASPTEAAAVGAVGATILTIANKKFNIGILKRCHGCHHAINLHGFYHTCRCRRLWSRFQGDGGGTNLSGNF